MELCCIKMKNMLLVQEYLEAGNWEWGGGTLLIGQYTDSGYIEFENNEKLYISK